MTDKIECSERVYPNEQWGSFYPHQCKKTAIVERNSKWYCKLHDPEYRKQKDAERSQKWDIVNTKINTERTAGNACCQINNSNPLVVAKSIYDMYEALRHTDIVLSNMELAGCILNQQQDLLKIEVKKALAKAEGK